MKQRKPLQQHSELQRKTPLRLTEWKRNGSSLHSGGKSSSGPVKPRKTAKYTGPKKSVKDVVKERANVDGVAVCEICGLKPGTNMHHRQPRLMGGTKEPHINRPSNLLWLCGWGNSIEGCHRDVESNRTYAKSVFWLVPRPGKPVERPVLRRGRYVWLHDDGEVTDCDMSELAARVLQTTGEVA